MDTKQTNRGPDGTQRPQADRARARRRAESAPAGSPQRRSAAPQSAQQRNGAARSEQEQRSASAGSGARRQAQAAAARRPAKERPRKMRRGASYKKKKNSSALSAISGVFHRNKKNVSSRTASAARTDTLTLRERQQHKKQQKVPTPAVIYTEPTPFNRNRLVVQLLTVVAVVLALVMGLSVFFKVEVITVTGADTYSAWTIRENSGIKIGDNLLTFSKARASGQIKANLPYVESVRIGIKLPNTVNIMIEEADVVYAIKSHDGTWWLMNSSGKVVEQSNAAQATNYTQVLGVTLDNPALAQQGIATEDVPTATDAFGEPVPVTVTGAQRLNVALQILQALEDNDIVGEAASVDVSRLEDIVLWYGTRYQVNLGDSTRLDYKIACMNDVVLQMSDYQSGILDISFNNFGNKVGYTPFE